MIELLNIIGDFLVEDRGRRWVRNTLKDHRRKGYEIAITYDELYFFYQKAMETQCPYCHVKMRHGKGTSIDQSPTLDVINPHKRVISVFNIQIICHLCNSTKRNRNHKDFVEYCRKVVVLHGNT